MVGSVVAVGVTLGLGALLAYRIAVAIVDAGAAPSLNDAAPVAVGHVAMIGAVLFATTGVARYRGEGFLAGTWVFAPLAPVIAAVVSVVCYLAVPDSLAHPATSVYLGLASASLAAMLFAFPGAQLARRDHAQMRVFGDLLQRYGTLSARVRVETDRPRTPASKALAEAQATIESVRIQLYEDKYKGPALRWVMGNGYTGIARELHRVEEALFIVEDPAEIVGDVLHDDLSLEDSGLKNRFTLRRVIRDAMPSISAGAAGALLRPVPALPQSAAALMQPQADTHTLTPDEAREALREVRFAINDYRDDIIDSFARGRNRILWTYLTVALSTYVVLGLGLLSGVSKVTLISVSLLYLVASLVGLFSRLRIESSSSPATNEDYGLYLARLLTGPLLSGLAGVAGVYLVAQAPAFLAPVANVGAAAASASPSPVLDAARVAAAAQAPAQALADVYDLALNRLALLVAAIFGLAPGLLTARLQQQVDRLERDLQRSEPGTSAYVTGGSGESGSEDAHG
jgi:hypothetical protein